MFGTHQDITQRKQAESALLESEAKYRNLVESMPDGFYRSTPAGRFLDVNLALVKMLGYDSREELLSIDIPTALYPRSGDRRPGEIVNPNFVGEMESYQLKKKDGAAIWLEDHCRYLRDDAGKIQYHEGVCRDVSERKTTEEKITALLREKELLLHEVHHRIKNNMIIVMSLLTLQADALKESSAASALRDAANRMRSMMLLYDKLYRSQNFGEISMKEYFTSLVDRILENIPNSTTVDIVKKFDDFALDVKILSPVGMIMNELLTNTMKYAFIGRSRGVITVSAGAERNRVQIIVQDDGVGMPESVDIGSSAGLGLHLVEMLAVQLDGTIRIERRNGTKFILEFGI
jgi:PAS domain S-box-containing protein